MFISQLSEQLTNIFKSYDISVYQTPIDQHPGVIAGASNRQCQIQRDTARALGVRL